MRLSSVFRQPHFLIEITAKYNAFDNCIFSYYYKDGNRWRKESLTNELEDSGKYTYEKIIKSAGQTQLFFVVDFDDGDWSITTSAD